MFRITKRIINWTGEYKGRLYKGFVYSFLNTIFIAVPMIMAAMVFNLILDDIKGVKPFDVDNIMKIFVVLLVSVLLRFFTAYRRAVLQESIGCEKIAQQRIHIGNVLKRVPLGFFQENNTGDLTSAVTTDLSYMEMYGMSMVDKVVNGYINALTMIICLMIYNIPIALVCVIGISLSTFILRLLGNKSKTNAPVHLKAQEDMIGATIEYIQGLPIVKAFGKQGVALKNTKDAYERGKKINIKIEKEFAFYTFFHKFILKLASVAIVIFASYFAINGSMSIPNMIMMTIFSFVIFAHVETINDATHVLELIDNTMDKLEAIENAKFIDEHCKNIELNNHNIEFDNVSFGYDKEDIIKNISFDIKEKTTTAIIGPSGCGKTTICNLIARFYEVKCGKILVGGVNIANMTCDSLLKNISMVFQNVYLFNDTVKNNILFGNVNASYEEVVEAAKGACCHDFIMSLPNGYDTIIGEGGSSLSGGEKQRISIARAILKDAPIIILDEATASVDPENEHYIQAAISALTKDKTIIIIAHRLATIENADQILVIDNGRIIQRGNHNDLIKTKGLYRKFIGIREKAENWNIA